MKADKDRLSKIFRLSWIFQTLCLGLIAMAIIAQAADFAFLKGSVDVSSATYVFIAATLLLSIWAQREAQAAVLNLESKCKSLEMNYLSVQDREGLIQLGQVSGGLIHEVKNPLSVIFGTTEYVLKKFSLGEIKTDKIMDLMSLILRNSQRINKTLESFRSLNHTVSQVSKMPVSATKILRDVTELTMADLQKTNIRIDVVLPPENILVSCCETDIHQVLKILIQNAAEAVAQQKAPWIRLHTIDSGTELQFCVTDSGEGIPADKIDHVFEPFYTTKSSTSGSQVADSGVGLGLNLAERILRAHSSKVWIDRNHPNTRFVFSLSTQAA
jgi:signal transduction histidine kinase